jgi:glycosyltransferase involved in cell wall biosynthesis
VVTPDHPAHVAGNRRAGTIICRSMSTRRFAIIAPNFYPRVCGVGDNSLRLAQELQRRHHEVAIFSRAPAERHPDAPGLPVEGVPGRIPSLIAHNLVSAIEAYRPTEIVFQYTSQMWGTWRFGSPATIWLMRRLRRTGARITIVAHELFVPWLSRPDLLLAAFLQRVQLAMLIRECERFFVSTETRAEIAAQLCKLVGAPAPQLIRIGANALPVERRPRSPQDSAATPKIGFFSTAAVGKKYDVVLDAFARIAAEIPGAELLLIGDLGPSEQRNVRAIHEAVACHPARARIRLTGRLSLAEVAFETAGLDLYLFPMETGANTRSSTLPSALGSGIPTVAVHGVETELSLFRDGENIVLADEMTGEAFAAAALRLLKNPSALTRVGEGGRHLYAEHLSWERIGDRLLADSWPS